MLGRDNIHTEQLAAILAAVVLCALYAAAHACDISDPCGAEPAPLPRVYLQHLRMSAEYTPALPVTTPEPEVQP